MSSMFDLLHGTPKKIEFINPTLDFKLNPNHFMKWLKLEGEDW